MLEAALIAGIMSVGADAITVGVLPTPAVAYLTRYYSCDAGVMISTSHNPMEDNGIMELLEARKRTIEEEFSGMNERQFEAVTTTEGPLLVLAGAGSGKTTVLVNRIAYLMKYGNAYRSTEMPYGDGDNFSVNAPRPWEILAITFTNKAANELKERIARKIGDGAEDIWAGTFHSVCGKILRINAEYIGHTSSFTIYDTDDQRRLMKEIMKNLGMDEQLISHKNALAAISAAKDALISPAEYEQTMGADIRRRNIAVLYKEYQKLM